MNLLCDFTFVNTFSFILLSWPTHTATLLVETLLELKENELASHIDGLNFIGKVTVV